MVLLSKNCFVVKRHIRILCKGEKANHTSPKLFQMRLPSGDLAETDEENAKAFAKHFGKVFNNNKSINNKVLNDTNSLEVMNELDVPPSWK